MKYLLRPRKGPETSNPALTPARMPSPTTVNPSLTSLERPSAPQLQNNGSSRLLGLPPEVRRLIYTYSLIFSPISGHEGRRAWVPRDKRYQSILLACRQIYWEACVLPFQVNLFRIGTGAADGLNESSLLFSRLRPWQAKEVRNLELVISKRLLRLPLLLNCYNLLGCKYMRIRVEGKLSRERNMDMLSKLYGFQSIAPNLEHLRITFEENHVCGEGLKHLEDDLKVLLPKIQILILRE